MKNRKFVTVSLAAALAIGTIAANGVLVSAERGLYCCIAAGSEQGQNEGIQR